MSNNELIATVFGIATLVIALYSLGVKEIARKSEYDLKYLEVMKQRDAEHIKAVVSLHFKEKMEEFRDGYAEVISMLKRGDVK